MNKTKKIERPFIPWSRKNKDIPVWLHYIKTYDEIKCSVCGKIIEEEENFCPNCGVQMEGHRLG